MVKVMGQKGSGKNTFLFELSQQSQFLKAHMLMVFH